MLAAGLLDVGLELHEPGVGRAHGDIGHDHAIAVLAAEMRADVREAAGEHPRVGGRRAHAPGPAHDNIAGAALRHPQEHGHRGVDGQRLLAAGKGDGQQRATAAAARGEGGGIGAVEQAEGGQAKVAEGVHVDRRAGRAGDGDRVYEAEVAQFGKGQADRGGRGVVGRGGE